MSSSSAWFHRPRSSHCSPCNSSSSMNKWAVLFGDTFKGEEVDSCEAAAPMPPLPPRLQAETEKKSKKNSPSRRRTCPNRQLCPPPPPSPHNPPTPPTLPRHPTLRAPPTVTTTCPLPCASMKGVTIGLLALVSVRHHAVTPLLTPACANPLLNPPGTTKRWAAHLWWLLFRLGATKKTRQLGWSERLHGCPPL